VSSVPADGRLTPAELLTLDAIAARLIPSDETGPGAREALVVRYIETALQADYAAHLDDYHRGLAATDRYSQTRFGRDFVDLAEREQDAVLATVERGDAAGFEQPSSVFFATVRRHTIEGMFGDPSWGGNLHQAGWNLIGYSGPKATWTAEEQAIQPIPARTDADGDG
jgi:gluconate 2-dehydrogenase gamma chain